MDYCHWYIRQVERQLWICIFHHQQEPQVLQNLCKVVVKAAYIWAQTSMHENVNAVSYSSIMMKERFSCSGLSQAMKHGWTTINLRANKEWSGNTHLCPGPRNSQVCLLLAKCCWHCFGTLMGPSSSTIRTLDIQSVVHSILLCLKRSWNPLFAVNAEECWQMELFCIMTTFSLNC